MIIGNITSNITSNNSNLDYNGKVMQIEVYEQLIKQLQQENKQLKEKLDCDLQWAFKYDKQLSNWNKLKEYLNYKSERTVGEEEYVYDEIYNEMQELEQGSDNNE